MFFIFPKIRIFVAPLPQGTANTSKNALRIWGSLVYPSCCRCLSLGQEPLRKDRGAGWSRLRLEAGGHRCRWPNRVRACYSYRWRVPGQVWTISQFMGGMGVANQWKRGAIRNRESKKRPWAMGFSMKMIQNKLTLGFGFLLYLRLPKNVLEAEAGSWSCPGSPNSNHELTLCYLVLAYLFHLKKSKNYEPTKKHNGGALSSEPIDHWAIFRPI